MCDSVINTHSQIMYLHSILEEEEEDDTGIEYLVQGFIQKEMSLFEKAKELKEALHA